MNVAQTLIAARAKIANFDSWAVCGLAYPSLEMSEVEPWHPAARCFCSVGAIASLIPQNSRPSAYSLVGESEAGQLLAAVIAGQEPYIETTLEYMKDGSGVFGGCEVHEIIFNFNDTPDGRVERTPAHHANVLAAFDEAIKHARAAGI